MKLIDPRICDGVVQVGMFLATPKASGNGPRTIPDIMLNTTDRATAYRWAAEMGYEVYGKVLSSTALDETQQLPVAPPSQLTDAQKEDAVHAALQRAGISAESTTMSAPNWFRFNVKSGKLYALLADVAKRGTV